MMSEIEFCRVLNRNHERVLFDSFNGAFLVRFPARFRFDVRRTPKVIGGLSGSQVS